MRLMNDRGKTTQTNNKRGFTLAELLIVVAILAILVAVSIPIFTGRLVEAKKAVCDANKRALKAHIASTVLQDETLEDKLDELLAEYIVTDKAACPYANANRGYRIEGDFEHGFAAFCDVHDGKEGSINGSTTRDNLLRNILDIVNGSDNLKNYFFMRGNPENYIDSGAKSERTGFILPALEKALDVDSPDIKTWSMYTTKQDRNLKIIWTSKDIQGLAKDTAVPVMSYDFTTGKFATVTAKVNIKDGTGVPGSQSSKYMGMLASDIPTEYDTYEEALAEYKKEQAKQ